MITSQIIGDCILPWIKINYRKNNIPCPICKYNIINIRHYCIGISTELSDDVGCYAGYINQSFYSVAIGYNAGFQSQGSYSVAIDQTASSPF